jgi:predicted TIM-barrel fold metal-dependent hydrolase
MQPGIVVDADSHVMEPLDLWVEHIDPAFRDRALRREYIDGVESLVIDTDTVILSKNLAGLGGSHVDRLSLFVDPDIRYEDGCLPASYDPAARVALLDDWGVDQGLAFPTLGILWVLDDVELASAHCRAYNRWMASFAAATNGRVLPVAHLNLLDPVEAEAELERCIAAGFKGVFLPPELHAGRRPGDPVFDRIWARCAEAGLPVCLHVVVRFGGTGMQPLQGWYTPETFQPLALTFAFSLGAAVQIIPTLATMVCDGVFDRVPNLKVLCVEAGCGWAAFLMDRLDQKYEHLGWMAPLKERPSHYLAQNVWYVAEPDERSIGAALELVGEDRILWGSDFPHIDSTMDAADRVRHSVSGLSEVRRAAVLGGNAAAVFPS